MTTISTEEFTGTRDDDLESGYLQTKVIGRPEARYSKSITVDPDDELVASKTVLSEMYVRARKELARIYANPFCECCFCIIPKSVGFLCPIYPTAWLTTIVLILLNFVEYHSFILTFTSVLYRGKVNHIILTVTRCYKSVQLTVILVFFISSLMSQKSQYLLDALYLLPIYTMMVIIAGSLSIAFKTTCDQCLESSWIFLAVILGIDMRLKNSFYNFYIILLAIQIFIPVFCMFYFLGLYYQMEKTTFFNSLDGKWKLDKTVDGMMKKEYPQYIGEKIVQIEL